MKENKDYLYRNMLIVGVGGFIFAIGITYIFDYALKR